MIVLLLVLVWLVVLTPVISHRLSSTDAFSSVMRFRTDARILQKVLGHREDSIPITSSRSASGDLSHREAALRNAEMAQSRAARRRVVARRRHVVEALLASVFGSALLGIIPSVHLIWVFSIVSSILLIGYLAVLTQVTRSEINTAERRRKVVQLPQTIFPVSVGRAGEVFEGRDRHRQIAYVVTEAY